jgi:hypothetical protein
MAGVQELEMQHPVFDMNIMAMYSCAIGTRIYFSRNAHQSQIREINLLAASDKVFGSLLFQKTELRSKDRLILCYTNEFKNFDIRRRRKTEQEPAYFKNFRLMFYPIPALLLI